MDGRDGLDRLVLDIVRNAAAGRSKAMPSKQIAKRLDVSLREVAACVERLRRRGHVIGAVRSGARRGLFWPVDGEDWVAALRPFRAEARQMVILWNDMKRRVPEEFAAQVQGKLFA